MDILIWISMGIGMFMALCAGIHEILCKADEEEYEVVYYIKY